jgi:hypothetical protein
MMKISRTDWKYAVDTLMFLSLLGIVAIGLLMAFVIPEGPAELGRSKYFVGLHRHQWGAIHLYLSLAFAAAVAVHIVLAWSWIKGKAAGVFGKGWKASLGLTVVVAVAVPFVFWLAAPKNVPAYAEFGTGRGRQVQRASEPARPLPAPERPPVAGPGAPPAQGAAPAVAEEAHEERTVAGRMEAGTAEVVITGRMTLRDVERATGIPAADIAAGVGLPTDVSFDDTIGRLRRVYGFEMQALRDVVTGLLEKRRTTPDS